MDTAIGARLARLPLFAAVNDALHIVRAPWPQGIVIHDLRKPLPWPDACVDGIYLSHVLEHFPKDQGHRLLSECYRVLRKQAVVRVVVPDLRTIVADYVDGSTDARDFLHALGVSGTVDADGVLKERLGWLFRFPHRCMYDSSALMEALRDAGFTATVCAPYEGTLTDLASVEFDSNRLAGSLAGAVAAEGMRSE